jgi:hypothetical protein
LERWTYATGPPGDHAPDRRVLIRRSGPSLVTFLQQPLGDLAHGHPFGLERLGALDCGRNRLARRSAAPPSALVKRGVSLGSFTYSNQGLIWLNWLGLERTLSKRSGKRFSNSVFIGVAGATRDHHKSFHAAQQLGPAGDDTNRTREMRRVIGLFIFATVVTPAGAAPNTTGSASILVGPSGASCNKLDQISPQAVMLRRAASRTCREVFLIFSLVQTQVSAG